VVEEEAAGEPVEERTEASAEAPGLFAKCLPIYLPCGHDDRAELRVLVVANGGSVADKEGPAVLALMPEDATARRLKTKHNAVSVRWLHACIEQRRLLPTSAFALPEARLAPEAAAPVQATPVRPKREAAVKLGAGAASAACSAGVPASNLGMPAARLPSALVGAVASDLFGAGAVIKEELVRGRAAGRLHFTAEEDQALRQWVALHPGEPDQGKKLWEEAEQAGITRHGWSSMQNRWRRQLMPSGAERAAGAGLHGALLGRGGATRRGAGCGEAPVDPAPLAPPPRLDVPRAARRGRGGRRGGEVGSELEGAAASAAFGHGTKAELAATTPRRGALKRGLGPDEGWSAVGKDEPSARFTRSPRAGPRRSGLGVGAVGGALGGAAASAAALGRHELEEDAVVLDALKHSDEDATMLEGVEEERGEFDEVVEDVDEVIDEDPPAAPWNRLANVVQCGMPQWVLRESNEVVDIFKFRTI